MNAKHIFRTALLSLALAMAGCSSDEPDKSISVITPGNTELNDFDLWLKANFTDPYNIDFKYRYEDIEGDFDYYLVPAKIEDAITMAHLVKYLCVETYNEIAGRDFTCTYFPKMFFIVGEWEYNNNHSIALGTAEGGRKIFLAGMNYLSRYIKSELLLNEFYFKTIHHEFTHILNQKKPIPTVFQSVTAGGYVAGMWNQEPYNTGYLTRGFISDYAQDSFSEDFAEVMSIYITSTTQSWEDKMTSAGSEGKTLILMKLDIVRNYLAENFNIDIDKLQEIVQRRQKDVVAGNVDLSDISL